MVGVPAADPGEHGRRSRAGPAPGQAGPGPGAVPGSGPGSFFRPLGRVAGCGATFAQCPRPAARLAFAPGGGAGRLAGQPFDWHCSWKAPVLRIEFAASYPHSPGRQGQGAAEKVRQLKRRLGQRGRGRLVGRHGHRACQWSLRQDSVCLRPSWGNSCTDSELLLRIGSANRGAQRR
jgi:hypothetical protein